MIVIFWTESPTTFAASPQMLIMSMQKHASTISNRKQQTQAISGFQNHQSTFVGREEYLHLVIPNCRARMASRYKQKTSELNHL